MEPRFHPNPPPKSTAEFRRYCPTDKNIAITAITISMSVSKPILPTVVAAGPQGRSPASGASGRRIRITRMGIAQTGTVRREDVARTSPAYALP